MYNSTFFPNFNAAELQTSNVSTSTVPPLTKKELSSELVHMDDCPYVSWQGRQRRDERLPEHGVVGRRSARGLRPGRVELVGRHRAHRHVRLVGELSVVVVQLSEELREPQP